MENFEIERKYLIKKEDIKFDLKQFKYMKIVQGFIYLKPAIRVRKYGDKFYFAIKSKAPKKYDKFDDLIRKEYEIEIDEKAYKCLLKSCKGRIIYKTRYFIPYKYNKKSYIIELDIFEKDLKGLIYAEIEFKNLKEASNLAVPGWFYKDITNIEKYKNTQLSICKNIKNVLKY